MDAVVCDKFCWSRLRGVDFVGCRFLTMLIRTGIRRRREHRAGTAVQPVISDRSFTQLGPYHKLTSSDTQVVNVHGTTKQPLSNVAHSSIQPIQVEEQRAKAQQWSTRWRRDSYLINGHMLQCSRCGANACLPSSTSAAGYRGHASRNSPNRTRGWQALVHW